MPTIKVNGIELYYEIYGEGFPLLFIGGLANDTQDYTKQTKIVAEFSKKFKVIIFDNRGVGKSEKPDSPYSMEMMAADAAGLLKNLKIEKANILGVSMGGRVALELALDYPELINKLILVSTGPKVVRTWKRFLFFNVLRKPFILLKTDSKQPEFAFKRQVEASKDFDVSARLSEIKAPTLILHGKKDGLAPFALAEEMHERIKNSKLIPFNGGHLFLFFKQKEFVEEVLKFS